MNITQTRFSRLSYAPETNNWELAAYEVAHLRRSVDVAVKLYPVFRDFQQKRLINDATTPALELNRQGNKRSKPSRLCQSGRGPEAYMQQLPHSGRSWLY